jgi:hypothetical protein
MSPIMMIKTGSELRLSIYRGTQWAQAAGAETARGSPRAGASPGGSQRREETDQPGPGSVATGKVFEPVAEDAILLQRHAELFGFRIVALPSGQQ